MVSKKKGFIALTLLSLLSPVLSYASTATKPLRLPVLPAPTIYPHNQKLYDQYPWAATLYAGVTFNNALIHIMVGQMNRWPEHVQSAELSYTLNEHNPVRRFFSPIVGVVQLAADVAVRNGSNEPTIYELDPYIGFRWANWPWNDYVVTSLSVGEGISYASSVPAIEARDNDNTKRLLNFLMLEATFSPPSYPRLQLVARVHHRSGAFGLYHAGNSGSNALGLAVRYLFD